MGLSSALLCPEGLCPDGLCRAGRPYATALRLVACVAASKEAPADFFDYVGQQRAQLNLGVASQMFLKPAAC
jgi:hypothetical protein